MTTNEDLAGAYSAAELRLARCLALDALAVEVVSALAASNIDSILLKGPATIRWLYPEDAGSRGYWDVDLLVAPADFREASGVLTSGGFRSALAGARGSELARLYQLAWGRGPFEWIELHRGFTGVGKPAAFWAVMHEHIAPLPIAGVPVSAPDQVAGALIYGLHAAQSGPSAQRLEDLRRGLKKFDDDIWRQAAELASGISAAGAFALGLSREPAGRELCDRLLLTGPASPATTLEAALTSYAGEFWFARMSEAPDLCARLTLIRDGLFPSRAALLAGRSHLIKRRGAIPIAYLRRWLSFVLEGPRALRHWRTVLDSARRSGWTHASTDQHP